MTWDVWQAAKKASRDMEVWLARPSEAIWAAMPSAMNLSTSSFSAASFTPELAGSASPMKSCTWATRPGQTCYGDGRSETKHRTCSDLGMGRAQ